MIGDRYELVEEVGRGGMGTVWRGRDVVLERTVAMKRVHTTDVESVERARREAQLAARLNDSCLVAVFDLIHESDVESWLIMEFVDGTSLAERVADFGALDRREVAGIGADVATALAAAHAAEIVHRDVKPSNVLLPVEGPAKLSDFGIARGEHDDVLTRTGLVTGSPAYLAPEVAAGQRATPASDVWSLGATLLHAATGRPPFDGTDHVMATLYRIVNDAPPRLDGDDPLASLIEDVLQHDPDLRPSAEEVAERLSGFTADATRTMPIAAPAPPDPTRTIPPVAAPASPTATIPVSAPASTAPASTASTRAASAPDTSDDEPDRRAVLIAAGATAAALAVGLALLLAPDGDDDPVTASPTSTTTTESPSPVAEQTQEPPSAEELESFGRSYVATAADDPQAGFDLLTPEYQQASGGIEGYRSFWDDVEDPTIEDISADTSGPAVRYTYSYTYGADQGPGKRNGKGPGKNGPGQDDEERRTETVVLQLGRAGDGFLISGATSG